MHSLTLISTLLAIVALVTSGPIDSSVNTYEAQDGGDDAFLEAYNADPNIDTPSITDDGTDPDLLAARPKPSPTPKVKHPVKHMGNHGQGNPSPSQPHKSIPEQEPGQPGKSRQRPGQPGQSRQRPGQPGQSRQGPDQYQSPDGRQQPGQPQDPNAPQDYKYDNRPSSWGEQGCGSYNCPFTCYNACPCWEYCKSGFCKPDLNIQDEPSIKWKITCGSGPQADSNSLERKCHDYCWNYCDQIKQDDDAIQDYYCTKFSASSGPGGPLAYGQMDGGVEGNDPNAGASAVVASNDPGAGTGNGVESNDPSADIVNQQEPVVEEQQEQISENPDDGTD